MTRFDFLGAATPSVPGYDNTRPTSRSAAAGSGLQESTLAPARQPPSQDYHVIGRGYPVASASAQPPQRRSTWLAKAPDRAPSPWGDHSAPAWRDLQPVARGAHAPQAPSARAALPQAWRDDPPPWTDAQPFPWPGSSAVPQQNGSPHALPPASSFQGHYTVKRRDTLAGIAGHYRVNLDELKRVNGIAADAKRVKTGTVLAIPVRSAALSSATPPRVVQAPARVVGAPPQSTKQASPPEPEHQPAARQDGTRETPAGGLSAAARPSRPTARAPEVDVAAAEVPAAAGGKFR
ncbi:MAG TPA: LysM peptidoglycan-binding domain-containing protein, partial [Hyphomicrobiaceae bacterium]|nr:LysM peptidoglycan-binding domain-containing protein [Hyphomicrobiaceae bacterium]